MQPIFVTKTLSASSSNTIGTYSTAATPAFSSGTVGFATNLDTQRRIILWSSASDISSLIVTLVGTNDSGAKITESLVGSTTAATPRATVQDFLSITSVSFSSTPIEGPLHIGTNTVGGTPWKPISLYNMPVSVGYTLNFSSTASNTTASVEITNDDPTQTFPTPLTTLTSANTSVPFHPTPFQAYIVGGSTTLSSAASDSYGFISSPFSAWRLTLTSTSSSAGTVVCTAVQQGV